MNRQTATLAIMLVLSLLANVTMHGIVMNARGRIAMMTYTPIRPRVVPGEVGPVIQAKTLDGASVTIDAKDSELPTVLYVFSPECGWCKRNHNNIETLISAAGSRFRFVALATQRQGLPAYLTRYPTKAVVFMEPSSDATQTYGLRATPTTIVISQRGIIEHVWVGAFKEDSLAEVGKVFGVALLELPTLKSN